MLRVACTGNLLGGRKEKIKRRIKNIKKLYISYNFLHQYMKVVYNSLEFALHFDYMYYFIKAKCNKFQKNFFEIHIEMDRGMLNLLIECVRFFEFLVGWPRTRA